MAETSQETGRILMPVLALRGMTVFPSTVLHFDVARNKSAQALEEAMKSDRQIFLVAQKDKDLVDPKQEDMYVVGTISTVKQIVHMPGRSSRIMVEGRQRGRLISLEQEEPFLLGIVETVSDKGTVITPETDALIKAAKQFFEEFSQTSGRIGRENVKMIMAIEDPGQLADGIASSVLSRMEDKQEVLEQFDDIRRLELVSRKVIRETNMAGIEKEVQKRLRSQVDRNQKEYYLREQMKAIQIELGDNDASEVDELQKRMESTPLNEEAAEKAARELKRLRHMQASSPEANVSRTYIEWLLDLPWGKMTEDDLDLNRARQILAEDHCGLDEVKERVIEYLAVLKIKKNMKGPILCFVGPPGVGKTSVAKSIARALGRKFVQMSLGGVRDEAEIRGHRRTYIGAIPGRIMSSIRQAGTMNPVFLFDEIDKMGADVRGDPASAMLEVLDDAQNNAFRDHYLEVPFDLSNVMFITTANTADTIPRPLLDRMEVIEISGYTEDEKVQIAREHLLPRQIAEHGLPEKSVEMNTRVLRRLIRDYTLEAGVRNLQRTIGKVVRKSAVEMVDTGAEKVTVGEKKMVEDLGPARFHYETAGKKPEVGVVNGLAWTAAGGDTLQIETSVMTGSGNLELTGSLGDVMKESAHAARTWVRAHAAELGIDEKFSKEMDVHIHVPEGAVPKDGPSAGVTMTTALVSALTGIPVRQNVAMTGEVTLRGRVLPIGGLKEKMLAARRAGIDTVVIPGENRKDLEKIPKNVRSAIRVIPVEDVHEVLRVALERMPGEEPLPVEELPAGSLEVPGNTLA